MPKLNLKPEELTVESFDTSDAATARGTVLGHETGTFPQDICACTFGFGTCDQTCGESCRSCLASCGCTGTEPSTRDYTCATGSQDICYCAG
jgi:hypothetical protein